MAQYRRRIFIINRKFQLRFALYVCSWIAALSFVYPLIVYSMFDYFIRYLSRDPNGPSVVALQDLRDQVIWLLVALQGVFIFVTFLLSIFMSHRIAGPLYKLSRFFAMAREGNLKEELFFREKDHFQELAQDYNDTLKSIRARLDGAAAEIQRALPESPPAARQALERALVKLRGTQG
jgi:methyl-accepting chemotaxis protein